MHRCKSLTPHFRLIRLGDPCQVCSGNYDSTFDITELLRETDRGVICGLLQSKGGMNLVIISRFTSVGHVGYVGRHAKQEKVIAGR
jgi:hypothetical protein